MIKKDNPLRQSVFWRMRKTLLIIFGIFFSLMFLLGKCSESEQQRLSRLKAETPAAYAQEMAALEQRIETEKQQLRKEQEQQQAEQQQLADAKTTEFTEQVEDAQLGLTYFSNKSMCRMNLTIMQTCLKALNAASQVLLNAKDYQLNAEQQQALKTLRKSLVEKQKAGFPNMRDAFGPVVRKMLWEVDITAKTTGAGYRTIKLTGGWFALNRNIKQVQEDMLPMLNRLRFKRAEYRWSDIANKYQYYELETPADDELVVWQGTNNRYIVVE